MNNRLKLAVALSTLAIFIAFSVHIRAGTELNYNATFDRLDGVSTHFIEPPGEDECTYEGWGDVGPYDTDGTNDGMMWFCWEVTHIGVTTGIRTWVTNPQFEKSLGPEQFAEPDVMHNDLSTTVYFTKLNAPAGFWLWEAYHYYGVYYWSCTVEHSWNSEFLRWDTYIPWEFCNNYSSYPENYAGYSYDGATAN